MGQKQGGPSSNLGKRECDCAVSSFYHTIIKKQICHEWLYRDSSKNEFDLF